MSELTAAASIIHKDEPAIRLEELNVPGTIGREMRRRQFIHVVRDDERAVWSEDLGPSDSFHSPEFSIPSLMEHTVAELLEMAEKLRNSRAGHDRLVELGESSSLIEDAIQQAEESTLRTRRTSVNGPSITVQRN